MSRSPEAFRTPPQNFEADPMVQRFIEGVDLTNQDAIKSKIAQLREQMSAIGLDEYRANQEGRMRFPEQNLGSQPVDREPKKTTFEDFAYDQRQSDSEKNALDAAIKSLESKLVS